jgi:hypothetical protein
MGPTTGPVIIMASAGEIPLTRSPETGPRLLLNARALAPWKIPIPEIRSTSMTAAIDQRLQGGFMVGGQGQTEGLEQGGGNIQAAPMVAQVAAEFLGHAVIFAHCPPSGNGQPSTPDRRGRRLSGCGRCGATRGRRAQLQLTARSAGVVAWPGN